MKPRPIVALQAAAALLVTLTTLIVLGDEAALPTAILLTVGAAIWSVYTIRYGWLLRRSGKERSENRRANDRIMWRCFLLGLVLPAALALADAVLDIELVEPPLRNSQATLVGLCAVALPVAILVSSSVDWYLIRAFREGVLGAPVCRGTIDADTTGLYTRYWVTHRMVSEFLSYLSVSGLIALIATFIGEATHSETGEDILNIVGLIGVLGWTLAELGKLKAALAFIRSPTPAGLGRWVKGRNDQGEPISGFVLDVAVEPGVQLISKPIGYPPKDISVPDSSVPLSSRRTIRPINSHRLVCPGERCEFWIPNCEVGLHLIEDPRHRD